MKFLSKEKLQLAGYIIFILSCIFWGLLLVVPWIGMSKGQLVGASTILIIAGEITFYLSIFLLGKSFYNKIKSKLKFWKKKPVEDSISSQEEIK